MGHSAEFGANAMATPLDLLSVCVMGHSVGPNITTQYDTKIILKLAMSFKGTAMLKSACTIKAYTTQVLNSWYLQKRFGSPLWPIKHYEFGICVTRQIRNRIREKIQFTKKGSKRGWFMKKSRGQKSHTTVPLSLK
jgi:hypothetical protein